MLSKSVEILPGDFTARLRDLEDDMRRLGAAKNFNPALLRQEVLKSVQISVADIEARLVARVEKQMAAFQQGVLAGIGEGADGLCARIDDGLVAGLGPMNKTLASLEPLHRLALDGAVAGLLRAASDFSAGVAHRE